MVTTHEQPKSTTPSHAELRRDPVYGRGVLSLEAQEAYNAGEYWDGFGWQNVNNDEPRRNDPMWEEGVEEPIGHNTLVWDPGAGAIGEWVIARVDEPIPENRRTERTRVRDDFSRRIGGVARTNGRPDRRSHSYEYRHEYRARKAVEEGRYSSVAEALEKMQRRER